MTAAPVGRTLADGLESLEAAQLSSVEFVQDYVQLRFDGPCLTAYTPPVIRINGVEISAKAAGYRDELCQRIGRRVVSASIEEGKTIRLAFEDGAVVLISLRDKDYVGPEAVQFVSGTNRWVV